MPQEDSPLNHRGGASGRGLNTCNTSPPGSADRTSLAPAAAAATRGGSAVGGRVPAARGEGCREEKEGGWQHGEVEGGRAVKEGGQQ